MSLVRDPAMVEDANTRLVRACTANGRSLLEAADAEAAAGRYRVGRSLAILALEEFAKAFVCRLVQLGFATFDIEHPSPLAGLVVDRHVLSQHGRQHELIRWMLKGGARSRATGSDRERSPRSVMAEMLTELDRLAPEDVARNASAPIAGAGSDGLEPKLFQDPALVGEVRGISEELGSWDSRKLEGFYVDELGERTPTDLTREEFAMVRARVSVWLETNERLLEGLPEFLVPVLTRIVTTRNPPLDGERTTLLCERCLREAKGRPRNA